MKTQLFGSTGLRVSKFCLGTMTFGTSWGFGSDKEECKQVFNSYLDSGGNFIDTANVYTNGESEEFLGSFLQNERRRLILSTKYSLCTDNEDINSFGNHRRNLVLSVEDSLKRLRTDYIDILWVHAWYFESRTEDVVRAIDDLIRAGKVLYWGLSDTPAWIASEAKTTASLRGWAPLSAIQAEYSLIERTAERELLPFAEHNDIAVTGWAPLAGGILSGKHHTSSASSDSLRSERAQTRCNAKIDKIVGKVTQISSQLNVTASQLSLAWLLHAKPNNIPIIGARNVSQLQDNLLALSIDLEDAFMTELSNISSIELGFPHDMLSSPRTRQVMFGSFIDDI